MLLRAEGGRMKKGIIMLALLAVMGCGSSDDPEFSLSGGQKFDNFTGDYSLRDNNCSTNGQVPKFNADQPIDGANKYIEIMIVEVVAGTTLTEGDVFAGITYQSESYGICADFSDSIGCVACIVTTDDVADFAKDETLLDVKKGDILMLCTDASADGLCFLSYDKK